MVAVVVPLSLSLLFDDCRALGGGGGGIIDCSGGGFAHDQRAADGREDIRKIKIIQRH
jgi:hypothetical protein